VSKEHKIFQLSHTTYSSRLARSLLKILCAVCFFLHVEGGDVFYRKYSELHLFPIESRVRKLAKFLLSHWFHADHYINLFCTEGGLLEIYFKISIELVLKTVGSLQKYYNYL
jgi:hypothetical protein